MTEEHRRETEVNQYFESKATRRRAELQTRPHIVYGATVWCTESGVDEKYCCDILPPWVRVGELEDHPITAPSVIAYGNTPAEACENFDRLWVGDETCRELLPDKQCPTCGASVYYVGRFSTTRGRVVCENGHEREVK